MSAARPAPVITFRTAMPLAETMIFEAVYEVELQMEAAFKAQVVAAGVAVWMFVDGELAGESYGVAPAEFGTDPDDPDAHDAGVMSCWSTTLLPAFQGRGLAKILCAYWLGLVRGAGYRTVRGQATTPRMVAVKAAFGAVYAEPEHGYAGTTRTAYRYTLDLESAATPPGRR